MGGLKTFYGSSVGKKITVAVTGALMVLFTLGHMIGNLQIFEGPGEHGGKAKLDKYAELLRIEPGFLWLIRIVLLVTVIVHVITIIQLTLENKRARGGAYAMKKAQAATISSRTMFWGGLVLGAFVVFHLLHLTTGTVFPQYYEHLRVYTNVVTSFQNPLVAGIYIVAMAVIFLHLNHGIKSGFETLGVTHPTYVNLVRRGGPILAFLIAAGFMLVPVAILAGWVK